MELPKKRRPAKKQDAKKLLLFGAPKTGKTTILADLDDCLIVDMEKGSSYVSAAVVEVNNMKDFSQLIAALKKDKQHNEGEVPYRYIVLDTLTAMEEISIELANKMYKETPMGANYEGNDVRTLANGAGYAYTRSAFFKMLSSFEPYCDTIIMVGHIKEKDITKNGDSFTEKSINLTGKTKDILCSLCDSIGLVYRDEKDTIIDFAPSDKLIVGSRQPHLRGLKIKVATSDEDNNISVDWSNIFIEKKD